MPVVDVGHTERHIKKTAKYAKSNIECIVLVWLELVNLVTTRTRMTHISENPSLNMHNWNWGSHLTYPNYWLRSPVRLRGLQLG